MTQPLRVVVLVSGSGTLLQALIDDSAAPDAGYQVVAVGADRAPVGGLDRAARAGIPTIVHRLGDHPDRVAWNAALAADLAAHDPDLVVLAGFMKLLGPRLLAAYPVINTHPALLPSFPGAHGVRDALAHGVRVTGTTCIWVDDGVDTGAIIDQRAVGVEPDDDEATLHERIKVVERRMLVDVVRALAADRQWARRPSGGDGG